MNPQYFVKTVSIYSDQSSQDYDCFYASVFEHENPALRSVPLVNIQVPLHDLQHMADAKKGCTAGKTELSKKSIQNSTLRL